MSFDGIVNRRWKAATVWVLLAVGATYLFFFQPGVNGIFPACPFHTLTGLNCPGCGTTRGLHQLLHGNVGAAFALNPLMVLSLPFLGYSLIAYTRLALTGRPLPQISLSPTFGWLLTIVILGFWVFRNTPFYPFPS
jgi:flagellar biosynthesis protein FliR